MRLLFSLAALALCLPGAAQDAPLPDVPVGVEVQARGPVHEAFASPSADPVPTKPVPKKPPAAIEEMPPPEKPEGKAVWIGGYWAWDDDRADFLWVSGVWRVAPPNKAWVAGYWRAEGDNYRWVPGLWTASKDGAQEVTYLPEPPAPPAVKDPGAAPSPESFYVPGVWVWGGTTYRWRAGYWARVQPGHVWVQDHYRWTPAGYLFVPGYWDLALSRRGILYAPVIISPRVMVAGFVYTPRHAVRDTVVVEAMFVRPSACHYYFGDFYGPRYARLGYESVVVYGRRRYEPIIAYEVYERRRDPAWLNVQINLYNDRAAGRAPLPPRTLVQQTTITRTETRVTTMIAPAATVATAKSVKLTTLDTAARRDARAHSVTVREVTTRRVKVESTGGPPRGAGRPVTLTPPRPPARIEHPRPTPGRKDKDRRKP